MNNNAVNISLTRLREYERGHSRNYFVIFEIALFIIIVGLLMFTLGSGVNVYRNISDQRWNDEQSRTGLTLIANSVHITDTIDAVGVGVGPEGQALVLTELFSTGAYETRIYLHEGNIVEEYAMAGTPYTPERATPLVESDFFDFSYSNNLLTVNSAHGSEKIMLHSVRKSGTGTLLSEQRAAEASGSSSAESSVVEAEAASSTAAEAISDEASSADAAAGDAATPDSTSSTEEGDERG
ncbi:MAG: DUF4860 domain-containing protein [Eggerthellaceae bacterium]|nr:DUF4860 domain-containing protein [Eggerthellaceae bacterium]